MAEGLISSVKHKAEGKMLFDVAESLMDELAHRSLVQVAKRKNKGKSWSKYKTCSVHDLIRELCLSKAKEEKFIEVVHLQPQIDDGSRANIARRLCINPYNESILKPYDKDMISHLRSLLVVRPGSTECLLWPDKILSLQQFKLHMKIIAELVYLKCLRLHYCKLDELPSSVSNLRNLEILDLRGASVDVVRNVLWKLKHLKYLYLPLDFKVDGKLRFKGLDELEVMHNYHSENCDTCDLIGLLKLKVLCGIFRMESDVELGKSLIEFIKSRELRHSYLTIDHGNGVSLVSWLEACFSNHLSIEANICRSPKEYDDTRFSSCLSKLTLDGCRMEEDPMILLEKLPNLRKLFLNKDAYLGTEMVCTANGFPKLQVLVMYELKGLKEWRVEEGAMPNLSSLEILRCEKLEMLPEGLTYLTALKYLKIRMPAAFKERIYGLNGVEGVDRYKISHVPVLEILYGREVWELKRPLVG